jgi:hypothetical protein
MVGPELLYDTLVEIIHIAHGATLSDS